MPLYIGSNGLVDLDSEYVVSMFFVSSAGDAGGIAITFSHHTPSLYLYYCTYNQPMIPSKNTMLTTTDNVWKITIVRSEGTRVVIHYNDLKMWNVQLSDHCTEPGWENDWNKEIEYIDFDSVDTVSVSYYQEEESPGNYDLLIIKYTSVSTVTVQYILKSVQNSY